MSEQRLDDVLAAAALGQGWALRVLYDEIALQVFGYLRSRGAAPRRPAQRRPAPRRPAPKMPFRRGLKPTSRAASTTAATSPALLSLTLTTSGPPPSPQRPAADEGNGDAESDADLPAAVPAASEVSHPGLPNEAPEVDEADSPTDDSATQSAAGPD